MVTAGIVAGFSLYVGFVRAGVLPNPFGPVVEGDLAGARSDRPGLRILFIGNSMTYYNGMPQMVQKLAAGDHGAQTVFTVSYTRPGWTLRLAAADDRLIDLIREVPWDTVVLQEQTGLAEASVEQRRLKTDPYVRDLQSRIAARGALTLLYMTWPYRTSRDLAGELGLPAAPVAAAFSEAYARNRDIDLKLPDGHHPNRAGSFLAACVFYVVLTGRDPSLSSFDPGLPEGDARFLEGIAAELLNHSK